MTNPWMQYLVWPLVKFLVAFVIVQVIVAAMNWIERRLLSRKMIDIGEYRNAYLIARDAALPSRDIRLCAGSRCFEPANGANLFLDPS